ncbi:MAG: hypothetical protein GC129_02720 [Proteobacteria bacterium]|nr:hypothetical protein [Pseudomonadota bacterium]
MHAPQPRDLATPLPSSQSGALFGLDARIALAIFGLLAVIVGYTAFGRIDMARHAALISELDAFDNALANYQADMGTFYLFTLNKQEDDPSTEDDITALWSTDPIKPGFVKNWNGPYLHRHSRKHLSYGTFSLFYAQPDRQQACTYNSPCAVWLSLSGVPTKVWDEVNSYYDEASGKAREMPGQQISTGRVQADGATNPRTLFFRTVERPGS